MEIPCAVVAKDPNGDPLVSLRGDYDFRNARVLLDAVQLAARQPGETIVVDLQAVTFMDSSGISALVRAALALGAEGRLIRLERANRHLIQILNTAGFVRFFRFDAGEDWGPPHRPGARAVDRIWQHTSFTIPARLNMIAYVRAKIAELVVSVPGGEECLDGIRLAVGEAASNAVRHGCCGNEELKVRVQCSTDGETLVVEITDPGPGFDPEQVPIPREGELREGGMGIHFMRLTMDEVTYRFDDRGTTVRLRKWLHQQVSGLPANGSVYKEPAASANGSAPPVEVP
jgi:serine/threonine-protein kinase RsbW